MGKNIQFGRHQSLPDSKLFQLTTLRLLFRFVSESLAKTVVTMQEPLWILHRLVLSPTHTLLSSITGGIFDGGICRTSQFNSPNYGLQFQQELAHVKTPNMGTKLCFQTKQRECIRFGDGTKNWPTLRVVGHVTSGQGHWPLKKII